MNKFLRTSYAVSMFIMVITTIVGSIAGQFYPIWSFAAIWIGLLAYMFTGIITELQDKSIIFKLIGVLIMLVGFVFVIPTSTCLTCFVLHGAAIAIALILEHLLNYNTTHRDFLSKFKYSLTITALLFCIMGLLSSGVENELVNGDNTFEAIINAVPIFIISVVSGILLLRSLRAMADNDRELNKRQLKEVFFFFFGCILIFATGLIGLIKQAVIWLLANSVNPLFRWISSFLSSLEEALTNKNPPLVSGGEDIPNVPIRTDITEPPVMEEITVSPTTPPVAREDDSNFVKVLIIFFSVLVLAIVIYIVMTKLLKRGRKPSDSSYIYEEREKLSDDEKKNEREKYDKSSRSKIRRYYAKFLSFLKRKHQCGIKPSDSCADVENLARTLGTDVRNDLSDFSDIYRKARYNLNDEPSGDDAKKAKELYKKITDK